MIDSETNPLLALLLGILNINLRDLRVKRPKIENFTDTGEYSAFWKLEIYIVDFAYLEGRIDFTINWML